MRTMYNSGLIKQFSLKFPENKYDKHTHTHTKKKLGKYLDLARELKKMWNRNAIPIIVGWFDFFA